VTEMVKIENFIEYKRREFCKDIKCANQIQLNEKIEKSAEYEEVRKSCRTNCLFTTWQFHHWLIEKGYLIIKPKSLKEK
jgi:c-di-GMP-related signal transduction protein